MYLPFLVERQQLRYSISGKRMLDFTVEHSGKTLDRLWQYINHSTACLGGQHPRRKALATDAKRRLTMDFKACSYQRKIGGSVLATDTKNYIYTNFLTSLMILT